MNNSISGKVLLNTNLIFIMFENWIKSSEGFSSVPYADAGDLPTIGYGMTYYPDGTRVTLTDNPISKEQADSYLKEIIVPYIDFVNTIVLLPINDNKRIALIDFCYNCGDRGLANSTLLKLVNTNPNDPKIKISLMSWVFCKGVKLKGLERRRKVEADLYFCEII